MSLQGKVALVTGAGGGIGGEIARRLARDGAAVALADLDRAGAEAVRAAIAESGGTARAFAADVARPEAVAKLYEDAEQALGPLDMVVHCAGAALHERFVDVSLAQWQRLLDVNMTGGFLVLQGAARTLLRHGRGGRIVVIGTGAAQQGIAGRAAYGATKAGPALLARTLAFELGGAGITVNTVSPGPIDTPHARHLRTPATLQAWSERLAIQRYGEMAEVAAAVRFLVSDEAAYITGQTLAVDGGLSAGMELRAIAA